MTEDNKKVAFAVLVREMREGMPAHIEYEQLYARVTREKYLALVNSGFTENQAMNLCKR